ncbi:MAG: arsenosugar biosynthesis radical SAM (seleno)protein ArsS [bacterium]
MLDVRPRLLPGVFPSIQRAKTTTLQVNLGYLCNQTCKHCHVNAGPNRTEIMDLKTIDQVVRVLENPSIQTLDLTGGAPELNPHFRYLVESARERNIQVMDRCNLTVLQEPGQEYLAEFLTRHQVEVVASLPCYLEENVDRQRGSGVFTKSIEALQQLNALGYGKGGDLRLNLVFNPQGPDLPPPQCGLERDYKQFLLDRYNVSFDQLFVLTNMPIQRFGSMLASKGQFDDYLELLKTSFQPANLDGVMCRNLVSVDWQGYLYDCDFNQMLNLPVLADKHRLHIGDLDPSKLTGKAIATGDHCWGCTAGQGSSCGGALD